MGPFYLSQALGLDATRVGLVLAIGPLAAAVAGVPAGRMVDRFGAPRLVMAGLLVMAIGSLALSMAPIALGISGYALPIVVITVGYALFQTANNTATLADIGVAQRGVVSGMLNLLRNLGLITGASAMGVVFAQATGTHDITTARPEAMATRMQASFTAASILIMVAIACAARMPQRKDTIG